VTVGWRALSRLVMPDRLSSEPAISGGRCSFFVRHVDCGSSNVAEAELMSLVGPVYNLEGYGIRFVSSPSQADALLMTGPPTENMLGPALAAFAVMPEPKAIVTVGDWVTRSWADDEGASPGRLAATLLGSYAVVDLPDTMKRAIVAQAPGDPPEPDVLIEALLLAAKRKSELRREEGRTGGERSKRLMDLGRELRRLGNWGIRERLRRQSIGEKP
jgi:Ni,Fe-hydrogenase III small subunit